METVFILIWLLTLVSTMFLGIVSIVEYINNGESFYQMTIYCCITSIINIALSYLLN